MGSGASRRRTKIKDALATGETQTEIDTTKGPPVVAASDTSETPEV